MSRSQQRRSVSLWHECKSCGVILPSKDTDIHREKSCPPPSKDWLHGFIKDKAVYSSKLEECSTDTCGGVSKSETDDMVFLSEPALVLCDMVIGDPVCIRAHGQTVVRTLWPSSEKTLTSVQMTKTGMEYSFGAVGGTVVVEKLPCPPLAAMEVNLVCHSLKNVPKDIISLLHYKYKRKIFCKENSIKILHFGKILNFHIKSIVVTPEMNSVSGGDCLASKLSDLSISELDKSEDNPRKLNETFYIGMETTKWNIVCKEDSHASQPLKALKQLSDVGGLDKAITELKDLMNLAFSGGASFLKGLKPDHGVLLHGPSGTGKTMLANTFADDSGVFVVNIKGAEVYSKYVGETELRLQNLFRSALKNTPSIIILDEIDSLCPKHQTSTTDQERRVVSKLGTLMDELSLNTEMKRVFIIATSSNPDNIDSSLRRPGRLGHEIEIGVPTPEARLDILNKLLRNTPHKLTSDNVKSVSDACHGFVGADLSSLCSRAVLNAVKRNSSCPGSLSQVEVTLTDFSLVLTQVKPSAMREALVQVPNVKWSDIGGRHDIKLKLQQAVEWPLTNPEAFTRLKISPPRGILLFGPPGCSKTMIAKALATESSLNFLSIKGPELFSKWVGESEKAVRDLFRRARLVAPAIIFFDELDALGAERSSSSQGGSNVHERVLTQLLTEIDGIEGLDNVIIVGATNRPDRMDKALLRPGRLDRILYVPLPDTDTRMEIFKLQFRKTPVSEDVNIEELVCKTDGYSCAEVTAVCHEAAFKALEEDLSAAQVSRNHFLAALELVTPRTPNSLLNMYENYVKNSL